MKTYFLQCISFLQQIQNVKIYLAKLYLYTHKKYYQENDVMCSDSNLRTSQNVLKTFNIMEKEGKYEGH